MSVERCRKPGCGAMRAAPCRDWDCPQQTMAYAEHAAIVARLRTELEAAKGDAVGVKALREALQDCIETLALVEHPSRVDPHHGDTVKALGERIGYGALMASAQASWREKLIGSGMKGGGEFVAGPCYATVQSSLAKARSALTADKAEAEA